MAVSQNVTEQRRRQRQLNRQNERLEEFAGVVSHDLRNPLAIAEGYLELARANPDPDHFDRIEDAHRRMRVLIEDLLLLAQEGREGARGDAVDLADVVETSWQNVETDGARLVVETSRTIRADRTGVQQLLENLVRNAVEHGSTGARAARRATDGAERDGDDAAVAVTVGDLDGEDGFYVADDGPGIPPADRTVVFERGHTSSETGTGLGLYIVEQVVDRHGWDVHVAESDDGGARFEISGVESAPEADGESMTHDRARSRPDPPDGVRVEGREPE
jgi:signal transduction histidine kinase